MTEQLSLMDYKPPAIAARDAALAQVEANNPDWTALAFIQFQKLTFPETFTAEQIRHRLRPYVGSPQSPNAWGAFTMKLLRAKLIEKTGEYAPMQDERSHSRITAVYRMAMKKAP